MVFVIQPIKDTLEVDAHDLGHSTGAVIHRKIDAKYPNRVLPDIGLVICRYGKATVQSMGGVCQGSRTYWAVEFDLIVFRPFVGEILTGTLEHSSAQGIRVSLGFLDSIFVPAYWMLRPSVFEGGEWIWETEDDRYPMPLHSQVRVKVKSWHYTKRVVTAKGTEETTMGAGRTRSSSIVDDEESESVSAMQITASICEDGLGLLDWWARGGDEEEEGELNNGYAEEGDNGEDVEENAGDEDQGEVPDQFRQHCQELQALPGSL